MPERHTNLLDGFPQYGDIPITNAMEIPQCYIKQVSNMNKFQYLLRLNRVQRC